MQNNNKFLNDFSSMIHGAVGCAMDVKNEIKTITSIELKKILQDMDLVTKEEFNIMQAMLVKSRNEQEELKKQLEALKNKMEIIISASEPHEKKQQ